MVYVLRRVIKESLTDKLPSWQRLKVGKGVSHLSIWERMFQAEQRTNEKALRQICTWQV